MHDADDDDDDDDDDYDDLASIIARLFLRNRQANKKVIEISRLKCHFKTYTYNNVQSKSPRMDRSSL